MQPTPATRSGQLGSDTYNLDAEVNDLLSPITGVSVQPQTPAPQFGELGSGTFGLDANIGTRFMTLDISRPLPRSVRASDFSGSLERIARAENPGASQREINNYVGQLFEINGITNARRIGADQRITLSDAYRSMASTGLQQYGQDIAIGEQIRQVNAARMVNANTVLTRDGITARDLDLLNVAYTLHDADLAAQAARRNFVGPLQTIQATGEIRALPETGFFRGIEGTMLGEPAAFLRQAFGGDPVNPITGNFENFNGVDRKLLAIAGIVPLLETKGAQGIRALENVLVKGAPELVEGAYSLISANRAVIDPRMLTEYALNLEHPVGGNKARVFESALGFTRNNADDLMMQLRQGVMNNTPIVGKIDQFGSRFTVDIPVTGLVGSGTVRSGWIYKPSSNVPELTTIFVK